MALIDLISIVDIVSHYDYRCPPTEDNFLEGIDNKTVRRKQNGSNWRVFKNYNFHHFFSEGKPYTANIVKVEKL